MIIRKIARAIRKTIGGYLYPKFNGASYATIPVWTPVSASGRLEVEVEFAAAAMGAVGHILADTDGVSGGIYERLVKLASDQIQLAYQDADDTNNRYVTHPTVVEAGKRYLIVVEWAPEFGVIVTVDGVTAQNNQILDAATISFFRFAANQDGNSGYLPCTIYRCEFVDHTPLQGGRFMVGLTAQTQKRYAELTDIPVPIGSTIEGWFRLDATPTTVAYLFDGDDGDTAGQPLAYIDTGQNMNPGVGIQGCLMEIDGVPLAESISITIGRHYRFKATVDEAGLALGRFGGRRDTGVGFPGLIGGIRIWNSETGQVWKYNNASDSGNLLLNSSTVDRLGADVFPAPFPNFTEGANGTLDVDNGVLTYTWTTVGHRLSYSQPVEPGEVYRVSFQCKQLEGGANKYSVYGDGENIVAPTAYPVVLGSWVPVEFDFKVPSDYGLGSVSIYPSRDTGVTGKAQFRNFSIRRVHALGTAEGEELLPDRNRTFSSGLGDWEKDPAQSLFEMSTESGRMKLVGIGGGTEIARILNAVYVEAGKQYRFQADGETLNNGLAQYLRLSYSTASSPVSTLGVINATGEMETQTNYFKASTSGWLHLYALVYEGVTVYWDNLSVVENTHGIWYEGGSKMTDAAADAARTMLPVIDREYDFANTPAIGPNESKLQGGYFIEGNGLLGDSGRHAVIPEITLTGNAEIEWWGVRKDRTGTNNNPIVGTDAAAFSCIAIHDSGHADQANKLLFRTGGSSVYGDVSFLAQDEKYHGKMVKSGSDYTVYINGQQVLTTSTLASTFVVSSIGREADNTFVGQLANLTIRDLETGKVYHYANKNDDGEVLRNLSDRDVISPIPITEGALEATDGNIARLTANSLYLEVVDGSTFLKWELPLNPDQLYRVSGTWSKNPSAGQSHVSISNEGAWIANIQSPMANGHYFRGADLMVVNTGAVGAYTSIENFQLEAVHSLATAEGEELIKNPARPAEGIGTDFVDFTSPATISATPSGAIRITNTEIEYERFHWEIPAFLAGKLFKLVVRVSKAVDGRSITGGPPLPITSVARWDEGIPVGGEVQHSNHGEGRTREYWYSVPSDYTGGKKLYFTAGGNVGGYVEISHISIREVTHGLWQNVDYVGANLLPTAPTTINSPWVDNGDGTYTIDGSQASNTALYYLAILPNSGQYKVAFEITEHISGGIWAQASSDASESITSVGYYEVLLDNTPSGNLNFNWMAGVTFAGTIRPLWVKELNPATGPSTVYRKYLPELPKRYLTQGDVVVPQGEGVELLANPTLSNGWVETESGYYLDGTNVANAEITSSISLAAEDGKSYLWEVTLAESSGTLKVRSGLNTKDVSGDGKHIVVDTGVAGNITLRALPGDFTGYVTAVSCRETNAAVFTGLDADDWQH